MKNRKLTRSVSAIVVFKRPQVQSPEPHQTLKELSLPQGARELPPPGLLMGEGSEPQSSLYLADSNDDVEPAAVGPFFFFSYWSSLSQIILNHRPLNSS